MEHIPRSDAQKFEKDAVTSWEYEFKDARLNLAPITIQGRYPDSGFTSNLESDSVVHVVSGEGMVTTNDGRTAELSEDDQIHLAVGDAYYFEGDLKIIYAASPKWTPEQTEHLS